jgi:hypothetical protein
MSSDLPSEVRDALIANASALDPIHIEWTKRREPLLPAEDVLALVNKNPERLDFFEPESIVFKYQGGRQYLRRRGNIGHWDQHDNFSLCLNECEAAFDGVNLYTGTGHDERIHSRPGYLVDTIEGAVAINRTGTWMHAELLHIAGFWFPRMSPDFTAKPTSFLLRLLDTGGTIANIERSSVGATDCQAVTIDSHDSQQSRRIFWLDPNRNFAVIQHDEQYPSHELCLRYRLSDFRQLPKAPQVILPMRVLTWRYRCAPESLAETSPYLKDELAVDALDQERIPDIQFQFALNYTAPGTEIADGTIPGGKTLPYGRVRYHLPGNSADRDKVIAEAIQRSRPN